MWHENKHENILFENMKEFEKEVRSELSLLLRNIDS